MDFSKGGNAWTIYAHVNQLLWHKENIKEPTWTIPIKNRFITLWHISFVWLTINIFSSISSENFELDVKVRGVSIFFMEITTYGFQSAADQQLITHLITLSKKQKHQQELKTRKCSMNFSFVFIGHKFSSQFSSASICQRRSYLSVTVPLALPSGASFGHQLISSWSGVVWQLIKNWLNLQTLHRSDIDFIHTPTTHPC